MCIVSYVKLSSCDVFTFSRDENGTRPFQAPSWLEGGIFAPLDLQAGGTWIGFNGRSVIGLQNGGKIKHKRELPYSMSRGQILLDFLKHQDLNQLKSLVAHQKVEPFTITTCQNGKLELNSIVWDGNVLEEEDLPFQSKWLNCSSTLYTTNKNDEMKSAFRDIFITTPEEVFDFHKNHRLRDEEFSNAKPITSSITQYVINGAIAICRYYEPLKGLDKTFNL
jgi:hypothetical protein